MTSLLPSVGILNPNSQLGMSVVRHFQNEDIRRKCSHIRLICHTKESVTNELQNSGLEIVVGGDANDPSTFQSAFQGIDRLLLICPDHQNRVEMSNRIIDGCKQFGVKYCCLISNSLADTMTGIFGKQFSAIEKHLADSGLCFNVLRCNWYIQDVYWQLNELSTKHMLQWPMNDSKMCPCDVNDIGQCACHLLSCTQNVLDSTNKRVFTCTGCEFISGNDMARMLSQVCGTQVVFKNLSDEEALQKFKEWGHEDWSAQGFVEFFRYNRETPLRPTTDVQELIGVCSTFEHSMRDVKGKMLGEHIEHRLPSVIEQRV